MVCFFVEAKDVKVMVTHRPLLTNRFDPVPPLMMCIGVLVGAFWIMVM
jgi:hypothetical protein